VHRFGWRACYMIEVSILIRVACVGANLESVPALIQSGGAGNWINQDGVCSQGLRLNSLKCRVRVRVSDLTLCLLCLRLRMHAFRHTFLHHGFNKHVANIEVITGHAGEASRVAQAYRSEMSLPNKQAILEQVGFDVQPPKRTAA